jgi:hypothetical protein
MIRLGQRLMEAHARATGAQGAVGSTSPASSADESPARAEAAVAGAATLTTKTSALSPRTDDGAESSSDASSGGAAPPDTARPHHRHSLRDAPPAPPPTLSEQSHAVADPAVLAPVVAAIPARYRDSDLRVVYSTVHHGASIRTFMDSCALCKGPLLLFVRDKGGAVFGAFTTEPKWKLKKKYYGTGEAFCFTLKPNVAVYPWSHKNKFFQTATPESIAMGGGGAFALFLGDMFERGTSGDCETFDSPMLSSTELFEVTVFEAWELVPRHI